MHGRSKSFDVPPLEQEATEVVPPTKSKFSIFKGLILAMCSGICYSSSSVIVKQATNLFPGQMAVYRFVAIFVLSLPEAVMCRKDLLGPKGFRFLLILRGIFGASNIFLNFIAFRYLPLGEAAVIIFSAPVFVTVAARIVLKEPFGIFQGGTVILTIIGILFTSKITSLLSSHPVVFSKEFIYGIIAAVASLVFSTCRFIVLRKVKSVHHAIIMFNNGWVSVVETVLLTVFIAKFQWHECGSQGLHIIIFGFLSFAGQIFLTKALQCELAGPVSTVRAASDIILAFLWQTFLFNDIPDIFTIIGAVLVACSVVFVGLKKWVSSLPEDSSKLKYFKWVIM